MYIKIFKHYLMYGECSIAPRISCRMLIRCREMSGGVQFFTAKHHTADGYCIVSSLLSSRKGTCIPVRKVKCFLKLMTAMNPADLCDLGGLVAEMKIAYYPGIPDAF